MQASAFAPNTNRLSVSLVDEDLTVRRSLQLLLRSANYEVRAYATAKALIADPGALGSACLITDWDMPTFDGLELLRHVRGQGWNAPAILMTSSRRPGLELLATDAGFQALLIKPLIDRVVLETVRSVIDRGGTALAPKSAG